MQKEIKISPYIVRLSEIVSNGQKVLKADILGYDRKLLESYEVFKDVHGSLHFHYSSMQACADILEKNGAVRTCIEQEAYGYYTSIKIITR